MKNRKFINYGTIILFTTLTVFLFFREKNISRSNNVKFQLPESKVTATLPSACCTADPITLYFGSILADSNQPIFKQKQVNMPNIYEKNKLYLSGNWDVNEFYAKNLGFDDTVTIKYSGRRVFMDAESINGNYISLTKDGSEIITLPNEKDTKGGNQLLIKARQYYKLIDEDQIANHTIEVKTDKKDLIIYSIKID